MAEVTMPRLSDTMEEGTVAHWLKQPGDQVAAGDVIAEIETDKAVMELEAFESGVLQQILVPEGETVAIGVPIALIGDGAVAAEPSSPSDKGQSRVPVEAAAAPARHQTLAPTRAMEMRGRGTENGRTGGGRRIFASPVARLLAAEHGLDLGRIRGTGPEGRILKQNVEDALRSGPAVAAMPAATAKAAAARAEPAPAAPQAEPAAARAAPVAARATAGAGDQVEPLSRLRRAVARSMTESKPGVPHIYVTTEIEMGAALALRRQINDGGAAEVKISVNDFVVRAAALALRKVPAINSSYAIGDDGQPGVIRHQQVNISVAVALDDGLVAPVVRDTDKKTLSTIAAEVRDLAARAREGKLRQPEIEGATFQVSNLGMFDVLAFVSVITPPQAGSLAVGSVRRTPVVRSDGSIEAAEIMLATLSTDHRVTDGATTARFLQALKQLLEAPMRLLV